MSRITIPAHSEVPSDSRPLLDEVTSQLGFTPNLHRLMSISPAVLSGFICLQRSLGKTLDRSTRDMIAFVVSEANGCHYCLAAHNYTASKPGNASPEDIARYRDGEGIDLPTAAAGDFARQVIDKRGHVTKADIAAVREAGFSDAQILEMVALSVQFTLSNYLNSVAGTEIDFPPIDSF